MSGLCDCPWSLNGCDPYVPHAPYCASQAPRCATCGGDCSCCDPNWWVCDECGDEWPAVDD
jgi:hypothetical protein